MGLLTLAGILALVAGTPGIAPAADAARPEAVHTNETAFAVPFRVDRPQEPGRQAAEVQLFLSTDRGRTWEMQSRVEPGQGRFVFHTQGDGEYWLAIRTLDRSGRFEPARVDRPGLRVVVDTTPPTLRLEARRVPTGAVTAAWEIGEINLDPDSLRFACRSPGGPWQAVPVPPGDVHRSGPVQSGTLILPPGAGPAPNVEIRAEVTDRAGNTTVALGQVGPEPGSIARAVGRTVEAPARPSVRPDPCPVRQVSYQEPVPRTESPRVVHSLQFDLDYGAGLLGGIELGRAELWGTRDGGRTWCCFGLDDDCRSPVRVAVHEPGLYGFKLAADTPAGPVSGPPRPGDRPDLWVEVRE